MHAVYCLATSCGPAFASPHTCMWRCNIDLAVAINRKTNGLITPPPKWVSAQLLLLQSCEKGPSIKYPPPPNFVLISCKAKICSKKRPPRWPCAVKTHWRIMEKSKVTNSEWLLSTDQHTFLDTKEAWLRFALWTPIKSSDQEPWSGVIKRWPRSPSWGCSPFVYL